MSYNCATHSLLSTNNTTTTTTCTPGVGSQPPGDVIIDNHLVHACAPGDEEVEDLGGDDVVLDLLPIPRELDGGDL